MDTLHVAKHQALSNDFLIALLQPDQQDALAASGLALPTLASQLCDRGSGIGADGLILATDLSAARPNSAPQAVKSNSGAQARHVRMKLLNSDGSSAEVSGNGLACLAHEVARGLLSAMQLDESVEVLGRILELTVDTVDGMRQVTLDAEMATASSGAPTLVRPFAEVHMPNVGPGPVIRAELDEQIRASFGSAQRDTGNVGNPHLVINAGRRMNPRETARLGAGFESHFPDGINVEFIWCAEDEDPVSARPSSIGMSVWERGAGLTQACGTGAVTAAVLARCWNLVESSSPTVVEMPGGEATISIDGDDDHPILSVPVEHLSDHGWPLGATSLGA